MKGFIVQKSSIVDTKEKNGELFCQEIQKHLEAKEISGFTRLYKTSSDVINPDIVTALADRVNTLLLIKCGNTPTKKIWGYFCQQPFCGITRNNQDTQKGILISQYLKKSISCISHGITGQNQTKKRIIAGIDQQELVIGENDIRINLKTNKMVLKTIFSSNFKDARNFHSFIGEKQSKTMDIDSIQIYQVHLTNKQPQQKKSNLPKYQNKTQMMQQIPPYLKQLSQKQEQIQNLLRKLAENKKQSEREINSLRSDKDKQISQLIETIDEEKKRNQIIGEEVCELKGRVEELFEAKERLQAENKQMGSVFKTKLKISEVQDVQEVQEEVFKPENKQEYKEEQVSFQEEQIFQKEEESKGEEQEQEQEQASECTLQTPTVQQAEILEIIVETNAETDSNIKETIDIDQSNITENIQTILKESQTTKQDEQFYELDSDEDKKSDEKTEE